MAGEPTYGRGFADLVPRMQAGAAAQFASQGKGLGEGFGASFSKAFAGIAIGAGLVKGFGALVSSAIDFESAFTGVIKTVDASEAELADLEQGIIDLSTEIPATAEAIAGVAEAAGQLGIETQNIEGFTRVMIDLGNTTNLSADQAASSLARFANITGLAQTDFDRLGSSIVALGNNMATTEAEITEMSLRLAGAGAQIGLTQDEIVGLAASLSSVGIEAEAGGTAFSRVFVSLAQAVRSGGDELSLFADVAGNTSEEFQQAFNRDAAGAIVTFVEGLGAMSAAGQDVFGVLEGLNLDDIRVRDALLRAAGAGDLFRESLELANTAWDENNALAAEAELRYGTTESQLQVIQNQFSEMSRELGEDLLPQVIELANQGLALAESFEGPLGSIIDLFDEVGLGIELIGKQFSTPFTTGDLDLVADALKNIDQVADEGGDTALAFANNLAFLGREMDVLPETFQRLQREAGLSNREMGIIGQQFIDAARAGQDVGFTVAELAILFQDFQGIQIGAETFSPELARMANDAAGAIDGVGTAASGMDIGDAEEELSDLEQAFADAATSGEDLRTTMQKIADPVFAAVSEFQDYQELLKKIDEDGVRTGEEQLELAEAVLGVGAAFEGAEGLIDESVAAIAAALGTTPAEVVEVLEGLGLDVNLAMQSVGAEGVDGLLAGVDDLGERFRAKATGELKKAFDGIRGDMQIRSPSKLTEDLIGRPLGQGVVEGWESELDSPLLADISPITTDFAPIDHVPEGATGGVTMGPINVYNPVGEPTEESLAGVALAAAVAGMVR